METRVQGLWAYDTCTHRALSIVLIRSVMSMQLDTHVCMRFVFLHCEDAHGLEMFHLRTHPASIQAAQDHADPTM